MWWFAGIIVAFVVLSIVLWPAARPRPRPKPRTALPEGTLVRLLDYDTMNDQGAFLIFHGVRRPILQQRTFSRLSKAVDPLPDIRDMHPTDPLIQSIPEGPPLELDGWTVTIAGRPGIYFLYHSRLYRVDRPQSLVDSSRAGLEVAIDPNEAALLSMDAEVVDGDWLNRLHASYEEGWEKLQRVDPQNLDVVVYWSTYSHHTGQWTSMDDRLSSLFEARRS